MNEKNSDYKVYKSLPALYSSKHLKNEINNFCNMKIINIRCSVLNVRNDKNMHLNVYILNNIIGIWI